MPTYEFVCEECNKPFTLIISIEEYEKKEIVAIRREVYWPDGLITTYIADFNSPA